MRDQVFIDSTLRKEWNHDTRLYTEWDEHAVQTLQRPYTAAENAEADVRLEQETEATNKSTIETNLEGDLAAMQSILDQTNAELRADPSQEIKLIAKAVRRLTKMALDDFSTPE